MLVDEVRCGAGDLVHGLADDLSSGCACRSASLRNCGGNPFGVKTDPVRQAAP
jgi:hypothetical protein